MTTIGKPKIEPRPAQVYMGIRTLAPFSGMSKVITKLSKEMNRWIMDRNIVPVGPPILRYHVIDMRGFMDLTFGIPVATALPADGPVAAGTLVAGRYASLIYSGSGLAGNKALIEWVHGNQLEFDRWDTAEGDNFRCRYESFLTDPKVEPRKTRWEIEVAIKLADEHS
jgi:hypothetical protein